jgi:hypothetical protein
MQADLLLNVKCSKHGKICKPLFSILKWWKTYSKDTLSRLKTFDHLRKTPINFASQVIAALLTFSAIWNKNIHSLEI